MPPLTDVQLLSIVREALPEPVTDSSSIELTSIGLEENVQNPLNTGESPVPVTRMNPELSGRSIVTPIVPTTDDLLIIWTFISVITTIIRFAKGVHASNQSIIGKYLHYLSGTHVYSSHYLIFVL